MHRSGLLIMFLTYKLIHKVISFIIRYQAAILDFPLPVRTPGFHLRNKVNVSSVIVADITSRS